MCEHVFVRWDNLQVESEASRALPGYREPAAIRTFDAPEALDVRFYEVQAKSILNRVPKASRMHPCVPVLQLGRYAGAHGGRKAPADR